MARLLSVPGADLIFDRRISMPARRAKLAEVEEGITEGIAAIAQPFVGSYEWREVAGGGLLDFESVVLAADGTYSGRVEATLVNSRIRVLSGGRCFLPEEGQWNAYTVSGQLRIRIRPTTSKARVYAASVADGRLTISRRGDKATLIARAAPPAAETSKIDVEERTSAPIPDDIPTERNLAAAYDAPTERNLAAYG